MVSGWTGKHFDASYHDDSARCTTAGTTEPGSEFKKLHTEPLKVRKVLTSSSSEKTGCRATRLMNLPRARLLPSMNSRSEMEVSTADGHQSKPKLMESFFLYWEEVQRENTLSSLTRSGNDRVGMK